MAIIKHTEYKIICDNCGGDVTEWTPARSQRIAIVIWIQEGVKAPAGRRYCEECIHHQLETGSLPDPAPEVDLHAFDNAHRTQLQHDGDDWRWLPVGHPKRPS